MFTKHLRICIIFILSFTYLIFAGLQIIPERVNVTYLNYKYVVYGRAYVNRYGRGSPYYFNIEGKLKHTWTNNVSCHFIFYEFLHNEYRRTFVEMHFKFCDMINKDPYIGGLLVGAGIKCPQPAAELRLMNLTVPADNFPHVWPFEKMRVDVTFNITATKEPIFTGYLDATFKKKKTKKKDNPKK